MENRESLLASQQKIWPSRRPGLGSRLIILLATFTLPLFSLEASLIQTRSEPGFNPAAIKRVAYLPLFRLTPPESGQNLSCPVGHELFPTGIIEEAAEAELSRAIGQALLAASLPVSFVPQAELNAAREKLKKEGHPELTILGTWQTAIAREVKADAVLFGFIYTYCDRVGGKYAASRAAAIAFCLHLVDPNTNRLLWSFRYEDEQKPLFDDLLSFKAFIKRKGQWITVSEMASEAATALLQHLPWTPPPGKNKKH